MLDKNAPITVDKENGPRNPTTIELTSIEELSPILETIQKTRTAAATKMNTKSKSHDGSSRSHAALILNLYQVEDGKF